MKHTSSTEKTAQHKQHQTAQRASAGPDGISLAPPAYTPQTVAQRKVGFEFEYPSSATPDTPALDMPAHDMPTPNTPAHDTPTPNTSIPNTPTPVDTHPQSLTAWTAAADPTPIEMVTGPIAEPAMDPSTEEEAPKKAAAFIQKKAASSALGNNPPTAAENRTGLPDALKNGVESLSGLAMDDVRVHYNSPKPANLQALAYAQGTDIHVAPGQERHLPHEAWHVVQQAQGRVKPTMQMKSGAPVNDNTGLEHEADVMGEKALQMHFGKSVEKQKSVDDSVQKSNYQTVIQNRLPSSPLSQNGGIIQMRATWGINQSARRHYRDGWGALYGITNDNALKQAITDEDNWDAGDHRVELGVHNHRDCYIRYNNSYERNRDGHTYTWHCGPAL